jgi:hypothetical protein
VRYIAFSAVALAGCGGGGSPVAVKPRAAPLQVAYYGALDETVPEQVAETGVIWSNGWGPEGFDVHLDRQLTIAKQFGAQEAIILVDTILQQDGGEEARVRTILDRLRAKGLLAWRRFTFFVVDEPEQQGFSAAMLAAATAKLHAIIADYPELAGAQLETNYGCANDFVGAENFDVIDCDRYDRSATETLGNLKAKALGKPVRQFIGGASPWKADPLPYIKLALCDGQVIGMGYFIRFTVTDRGNTYEGINVNGMAPAFAAASQLARTGTCG